MNRSPFAPLVQGGEGLDLAPQKPTALRQRMAALYGVPDTCVLVTRDVSHALEIVSRSGNVTAIDERFAEFADTPSRIGKAITEDGVAVLRSLTYAYGLAGAPCGAIIASPTTIEGLATVTEPAPLATPVAKLALAALDPSRLPVTLHKVAMVKAERARLCSALRDAQLNAYEEAGPFVCVARADAASLNRFAVPYENLADGGVRILIRADTTANDAVLRAFGLAFDAAGPRRTAEIARDTKETRIAVAIDLDREGDWRIDTGVGYLDHMLAQVAQHGGFSLTLTCQGDLEIDAHHTIEDCALAFGQALSAALGDRKGIARFGFLLPMDETEAQVSLDVSGRPYCVFEGRFNAPLLGAYPTEMTEHVFRSLSQTLGAAIHVKVTGDNDHHKTEACFKALGRALRQALRMDGEALPSTKGVL